MKDARKERHYAVVLLIVSAVVLTAGTVARRYLARPQPQSASPPDLERLQRLSAERRLTDLGAYLRDAAGPPSRRLVSPGGLAWDQTTVLAPPASPDRLASTVVAADGRPVALTRATTPPGLPFSVWNAPPGGALPRGGAVRPRAGDWVLAVARNQSGEIAFAHGLYQGEVPQRCGAFDYQSSQSSAALTPALAGGALFTLDGGLVGYIAECEGRPIVIAASTITQTLARPVPQEEVFEHRYGFRLSPDKPGLVTAVWEDSAAAAAGLRPGDVIAPETPSDRPLVVKRGSRTVRLSWSGDSTETPSARGVTFEDALSGATVRAVAPESPAAAAGLQPGDIVIRIAGSPVPDAESAAGALNRARGSVLITVDRAGRRLEALIQP